MSADQLESLAPYVLHGQVAHDPPRRAQQDHSAPLPGRGDGEGEGLRRARGLDDHRRLQALDALDVLPGEEEVGGPPPARRGLPAA